MKKKARTQPRHGPRERPPAKSRQRAATAAEVDPIQTTASKLMLILGSMEPTRAEEAGFLERWIATYIAELLDGETKSSGSERAKIRKEISTIVPALWEQQLQRASLAVRREIDWRESRVDAADVSTVKLLRKILESPSRAPDLASHSKVDVMQWLIAAERLLINHALAYKVSRAVAADESTGVSVDVLRTFLRRDEESKRFHGFVFRLVPSLKKTDPNNHQAIETIVGAAVERLLMARLAIATSFSGKKGTRAQRKQGARAERSERGPVASRVLQKTPP